MKKAEPAAALDTGPDVCARPPSFSSRMSCEVQYRGLMGTATVRSPRNNLGAFEIAKATWHGMSHQLILVHRPPQPERAQLEDLILHWSMGGGKW